MAEKANNEKLVVIRVPGPVKVALEKMAAEERRSMNQQAIVILEAAVKQYAGSAAA